MIQISPWQVWFADLGIPVGHEQRGKRPAIVVSSLFHLKLPSGILYVVPLTTRNRGLPHHTEVSSKQSGLMKTSWARTDDLQSISVQRLVGEKPLGKLSDKEIDGVRRWTSRMCVFS